MIRLGSSNPWIKEQLVSAENETDGARTGLYAARGKDASTPPRVKPLFLDRPAGGGKLQRFYYKEAVHPATAAL